MQRSMLSNFVLNFTLLFCTAISAIGTTVTGTVADATGQTLNNGKMTVEFLPKPGTSGSPVIPPQNVNLDSGGGFAITLTDNNTIVPSGSQYKFTICPAASTQCSSTQLIITGGSINISTQLSASVPAIKISPSLEIPRAYSSGEIDTTGFNTGTEYYDMSFNALGLWTGTSFFYITPQNYKSVDATLFTPPGTSKTPCDKIALARQYAVNQGWINAIIDARGFHSGTGALGSPCPISLFTNNPNVVGNGSIYHEILMTLDITFLSDVSQVIPQDTRWIGFANNNVGVGGTWLQASNNYPTVSVPPLIQFGASTWSGVVGNTPPEGVEVEGINLNCDSPNGVHRDGMIGILNQFSQENSWAKVIGSDNCGGGALVLRNGGPISGSLNSGPYDDFHVHINARATTERCFAIGDDGVGTLGHRGLHRWSCNKGTGATQPQVGWQIDNRDETSPYEKLHGEGFVDCMLVGSTFGAEGVSIRDSFCTALAGFNQANVIHLSNANPTQMSGFFAANIDAGGITTNLILDDNTAGCTIPGSSQFDHVGLYAREKNNQVFTTRSDACPNPINLNATTTQAVSLINVQGNASNPNTINLINVDAKGTGERPFADSTPVATTTHSAATSNWILAPKTAATSGSNVTSFQWQFTANCWNGTTSVSHTMGWRILPGAGTNPTMNIQPVKSGGCGGKDVFDLTGLSRLQTLNIRSNTAVNTDLTGRITLAGGTGSFTLVDTYTSAPDCFCADVTTPANACSVAETTTTLTFTGTGTDVVKYHCDGRN